MSTTTHEVPACNRCDRVSGEARVQGCNPGRETAEKGAILSPRVRLKNLNPWRNRRRIAAFFSFPLGFLPSVPSTMRLRSASAGTSKHCSTGKLTICWLWQGPSGLKSDQRARVAVREPGERSCPAVCCFGPSNDGAIGAWGLGRGGCDVEPRLRPASSLWPCS